MNDATDSFRAPELLRRDGGLISATPAPHFGWDEALTTDAAEGPSGMRPTAERVEFSFVVPVKDEQLTLAELYQRISAQFGPDDAIEVIFVDDGSRDSSWEVIRLLADRHPGRVRGLRFRRNAGKAAALSAGFRAARGEVVFTLDADLQDDPKEIHRFLAKLFEGYDLVSGWKRVRHDPWHKVLPSRIFNWILSRASKVRLHDHNCGFKCYQAVVPKSLTLYGEMHRMIPALAAIEGFRAAEIEVEHHARKHGKSKYGFERYLRGFMDMLTVSFLRKYRERPSHFTGGFAVISGLGALGLVASGAMLGVGQSEGAALFLAGVVMLATAIVGFLCGLLGELMIRGGLRNEWRLPITEDTEVPRHVPTNGHFRPITTVPLTYSAGPIDLGRDELHSRPTPKRLPEQEQHP
jgi:dolichol-phosphate mannosyltransferase